MAVSIRLQKLLAEHGIASRRRAEELIAAGLVRVNGRVVREMGVRVDPQGDAVEAEGRPLLRPPTLRTLLLHKPVGVLSSCSDPFGRTTVIDLLPPDWQRGQGLHPVGRLDHDSSGALLITNDGDLTYRLTHPRHRIPKVYRVLVEGRPTPEALERWHTGVLLEGRPTLPARVVALEHSRALTLLEITLTEGRNRQIRKVAELLGHPVVSLQRVAIGPVKLGNLSAGKYRLLEDTEVEKMRAFEIEDYER